MVTAETPEGILLELRPAGINPRLYAFLLDWGIRLAVLYVIAIAATFFQGLGVAFWLIVIFLAEWFYPVVFELSPSGATPGKRVFGLKVVMDSGLPVTVAASVTRNLLRFADFLPFGYGFAIISNCDGQGAFIVLGCIVNPDRSLTLADLCIRAAADIRDGFVNSGCTQAEVEELLNEMRSQNLHFTRAPLRPVAALVRAAAERTRAMGVKIPRDAKVAMAQWERIPPESTDLPAPLGRRATTEEVEALLDRPGYGSWFFDEGDLGGAGVSPPGARQSVERWAAKAALALARQEPIRQRVVAMCEHMARWHAFAGDTDAAHLCATLTVEVKEDFKNSALVTSMAARVLRPDASEPQRSRRPYIKQHFFADVKKPTGRDLAILDFTEAADTALDRVMTSLPGESRPRDEQLLDAAHGIGRTFAAYILAPRKSEMGALIRELSDVLAKSTRLTPREQQQIAVLTLQQLAGFVDEVCGQCPVGCLDRPRMNAAAPFFAPGHPVLK